MPVSRLPSGVDGPAGLASVAERIATIQAMVQGAARGTASGGASAVDRSAPTARSSAGSQAFADLLEGAGTRADPLARQAAGGAGGLDPLELIRGRWTTSYDAARAGYAANGASTTGFTLRTTRPDALPPVSLTSAMEAAGNGNLPASMLVPIGVDGHQLSGPAAAAFRQLLADARRDGITIGVSDSYRSYADQVDIANRLGLYGQGGWAAVPGTSNHGWGLALDLDLDDRAQQWMRDNGWRYSFFEDVPDEPWHWTYRG